LLGKPDLRPIGSDKAEQYASLRDITATCDGKEQSSSRHDFTRAPPPPLCRVFNRMHTAYLL